MRFVTRILYSFVICCSSACSAHVLDETSVEPSRDPLRAASCADNCFWWHVNVKVHWPENASPDFAIDGLLANEIFAPILKLQSEKLSLWRFHRRAIRDESGHVFSLLFYAPVPAARNVFRAVDKNRLLSQLEAAGILDSHFTDKISAPSSPKIEDTSDKRWSIELQRAWPYFIMGASQMWLDLVAQVLPRRTTVGRDEKSLDFMVANYELASDRLDAIWHDEGKHAFLHHLSAIMGYGPIALENDVRF